MINCYKCGKLYDDAILRRCPQCGASSEKPVEVEKEVKKVPIQTDSPEADDTLNAVANIILIVGVVSGFISFFILGFIDGEFNPMGAIIALSILFGSIAIWAIMKTIRNISINARNTYKLLEKQNKEK